MNQQRTPARAAAGKTNPLMLAVVIALVAAIIAAMWAFSRGFGRTEPQDSNRTPVAGDSSSPQSVTPTRLREIPHSKSTRTPPYSPTGEAPTPGIASVTDIGTATEFRSGEAVGLLTVLNYEWTAGDGSRKPPKGFSYLAVQLEFEAVTGNVKYNPARTYVADTNSGRYEFIYNSALAGYPQFSINELAQGEVMRGWVVFALPKQDVTFVYSDYSVELLRVNLPGGPAVNGEQPSIALGNTFEQDEYSENSTLVVEGASWFVQGADRLPAPGKDFLGVKVKLTARDKGSSLSASHFIIETAGGRMIDYTPLLSEVYGPQVTSTDVSPADSASGWIYFELPRGEVKLHVRSLSKELGTITIQG